MQDCIGHRALVTGAAQGLGTEIARILLREGARVVLADVQADLGQKTANELGRGASFTPLDVRDRSSWREAYDRARETLGGLDILVNNAGISGGSALASIPEDEYINLVAINQTGVFLGMQTVLPDMIAAGKGSIVNVASVAGFRVQEGRAVYSATKHAVVAMTKAAALENGPHGVRLNVVCPGTMNTSMMAKNKAAFSKGLLSQTPLRRIGEASEIAELVAFVASDRASYCTGALFVADGGWSAGFSDLSMLDQAGTADEPA